jgi:hypothetical protein
MTRTTTISTGDLLPVQFTISFISKIENSYNGTRKEGRQPTGIIKTGSNPVFERFYAEDNGVYDQRRGAMEVWEAAE